MNRSVCKAIFTLIRGMAFASMLFLTSCTEIAGSGNIESQKREATNFQGISLSGVANVNVHPGEDYKVEVTTDDNIQDFISIEVENGVLNIATKENIKPTKLTVDVCLPELQSVNMSGVGNMTLSEGSAPSLKISVSGVGSIDAQNYQVQNVTVQNSGVGSSKIWATGTLSGKLSGVGSISYKGNPEVNVKVSGVGELSKL